MQQLPGKYLTIADYMSRNFTTRNTKFDKHFYDQYINKCRCDLKIYYKLTQKIEVIDDLIFYEGHNNLVQAEQEIELCSSHGLFKKEDRCGTFKVPTKL